MFRDLGRMSYGDAWALQTEVHKGLVAKKLEHRKLPISDFSQAHQLLFVEHPPVYTLGKSGSKENLLLSEEALAQKGVEFYPINRGGDITFHGPEQLVAYPILDLDRFFTDVHKYVRSLEEIVIRTLADYGIEGIRLKDYTGVWVEGPPERSVRESENTFFRHKRKLCAIGVHLSRWVTLHGLAFNVNTPLEFFEYIVPCGIDDADKKVSSLEKELGAPVDMNEVKERLLKHFEAVFECRISPQAEVYNDK